MTSPILADVYANDVGGKPNITALASAGRPWIGVGLKVSEGTYYPSPTQAQWLNDHWQVARTAAGVRYGDDWFRWGYHYYRAGENSAKQGELYLKTVENAGGWGPGDLRPMIDVETAENAGATATQVVDEVTELADYLFAQCGVRPLLYAGSFIRDLGIVGQMGCKYLSTACYGSVLPSDLYTKMGWMRSELFDWQYQGTDGWSGPAGYQRLCPLGAGPLDLSVVTLGDTGTFDDQLAAIRQYMLWC